MRILEKIGALNFFWLSKQELNQELKSLGYKSFLSFLILK
jgi:hypothetical protein